MFDAGDEIGPPVFRLHVARNGNNVARPYVAGTEAHGARINLGNPFNVRVTGRIQHSVGKGGLDFAGQRVRLGHRVVHPLHHAKRPHIFQGGYNFRAGEGAEAGDVYRAHFEAQVFPNPIYGRFGRVNHRAHSHNGVFGVCHAVTLNHVVLAAGQLVIIAHCLFEGRHDFVIVNALGNFALHVAVLILHDAGHHRIVRVKQVQQRFFGRFDVQFHQFWLRQADVFHCVGGQKAVLHVEERGDGFFGRAPGDQGQVGCALGAAGKEHSPAHVFHSHHVVVPGVDVEALAGKGAGADVEHHRQPLAADGVQHFFHQNQPLPGGEVGDAPAGQSKPFADGGGTMFTFRLKVLQLVPP